MIYKSTIEARDGTIIPVYSDGKTMFSRYAPLKEVEKFGEHINFEKNNDFNGGFFVVAGLGNGIHIQSLRKRFPESYILVVENSQDDIQWLKDEFNLSEIFAMDNLWITDLSEAIEIFRNIYNPLMQGNFIFLPVRSWIDQIPQKTEKLKDSLQETLSYIAGDYSTQAYFGKIWFRNFFLNLTEMVKLEPLKESIEPPKYVGAFVAAAGPSLENYISDLQNKELRKRVYLIATDTALPVLLRHKITPDMAVTIDGQTSSTRHFLRKLPSSMVLAADLTCNPDVVKRCVSFNCPVIFFRNKNPLSMLLDEFLQKNTSKSISEIDIGAGTVTSAAVDIAYKLGFAQIQLGGGDFAYIKGKPYCRGTYFEDLFCSNSKRTQPIVQKYTELTYRNKTNTKDGKTTTTVLDEYKKCFQEYIKNHYEINFITDSKSLYTTSKKLVARKPSFYISSLTQQEFKNFIQWYKTLLDEKNEKVISSILPLFGWYIKKNNEKCDIFYIMKLAYSLMVRYTETYGK